MFNKLFIIATATAVITPASFAADLYTPSVAPTTHTASGFDWSGIYAGAVGGYVWGHTTTIPSSSATVLTVDPSGGQIGVTIGANARFDQFVLGLESEVLWSGATGSYSDPTGSLNVKSEWQGAVKARVGVAFDQVLVYAHGGIAFADAHFTLNDAIPSFIGDHRTTRTGWTVGAGIEVAVTDNVSVKGEYAYSDLGKWTGAISNTLGSTDFSYTSHAVKAGVNFHF